MTHHTSDGRLLAMRDIADGLLESADGTPLGRVADITIHLDGTGEGRLAELVVGPEALAGRVATRLRKPASRLLRGRFEHRIPMSEVAEVGPTVRLKRNQDAYGPGSADRWVFHHILRFIPGHGRPQ